MTYAYEYLFQLMTYMAQPTQWLYNLMGAGYGKALIMLIMAHKYNQTHTKYDSYRMWQWLCLDSLTPARVRLLLRNEIILSVD